MYRMVLREYDLREDEQEQADFIISKCNTWNLGIGRGERVSIPEKLAFEKFRADFYRRVWNRLFSNTERPPLSISDDGKRIIWFSIEKEIKNND